MSRIAIVGRPNVGKSTLFNRLAGRRLALVDDQPGVTRDRREAEATIAGHDVVLIDTAGFEDATDESLEARMRAQTDQAIADAQVTLFVIDARAGVTGLDEIFADHLRRAGVPVILIANKVEGRAADAGLLDAYALGFDAPIAVSAEHGLGLDELEASLAEILDPLSEDKPHIDAESTVAEDDDDADGPLHIAIVGRPNVGKSTLVNRLIGEDRLLTGPEAGITRDTIAINWTWRDQPVRLYDTAGMRRRAKVTERLEKMSVGDTLNAIRFAHVVILVLDIESPLEKQDLQIADLVVREGRGLVLAVNKSDTVSDLGPIRRDIEIETARLLPQVRGLPVRFMSAKTGKGVEKVLEAALGVFETWNRRVPTAALNRWLDDALAAHPPPAPSGRRIKIRYITQPKARPPTFIAFCSRPSALPASYQRYLVNGLRETFDLEGVPIRLTLRKGDNPYAGKANR